MFILFRVIFDGSDIEKVIILIFMKKVFGFFDFSFLIRGIILLKGVSFLDISFLDSFKDLDDGRNLFVLFNFMLNMKKMFLLLMRSFNIL